MTSTAVVGSTGLVGSYILTTLLTLPSTSSVSALARRQPASSDTKLHPLISADNTQWSSLLSSITPPPSIFYSALGTTRGAAGSLAAQRKIDYDLNLSLAETAKKSGVKVYVLISVHGASASSSMAYSRMKGELEDAVKALDFEHTVLVRPGLIMGQREESRAAEAVVRKIAGAMNMLGHAFTDFWAQDAEVIARAAVSAGFKALEGGAPKVWEMPQAEIVKLGRTEWKA